MIIIHWCHVESCIVHKRFHQKITEKLVNLKTMMVNDLLVNLLKNKQS